MPSIPLELRFCAVDRRPAMHHRMCSRLGTLPPLLVEPANWKPRPPKGRGFCVTLARSQQDLVTGSFSPTCITLVFVGTVGSLPCWVSLA